MSDVDKIITAAKAVVDARAQVELEFAKVKLFWAKYGHPALYAAVATVSAWVGHLL